MRFLKFALIILLVLQSAGCVAVVAGGAAGAGTVVYFKGQLEEEIKAPVPAAHKAVMSALWDLKLPVLEDNHDSLTAKMKSKLANGTDVWITIDSVAGNASKVTIRVGMFGDEEKSRMILDAIHRHI